MCHRQTEGLGATFESLAAVAVFVCGVAIAIIDHSPAAVWAAVIVAGGGAWQAWDMREAGEFGRGFFSCSARPSC